MIYILYESSVFDDCAQMLNMYFGAQSRIVPRVVDQDALHIVFGAHDLACTLPKNYIVYQLEQYNSSWFTPEYIKILNEAISVYDFSLVNSEHISTKYGIKSQYVPLGYAPGTPLYTPFLESAYNALFIGSMNERRKTIIAQVPQVEAISRQLWREERLKVLRKARIVLNIHYYEGAVLETARITALLQAGCFVLSERSSDPHLDAVYEDLVVFIDNTADLDKLVNYWLTHEDERIAFAKCAQQLYVERCAYTAPSLTPILTSISAAPSLIPEFNELPEPDNCPFNKIELVKDKENPNVFKLNLPVEPGIHSMPPATIVTITRDRPELFKLAINNWRHFNYSDNLQWVIVDDSLTDEIGVLVAAMKNVKYIHIPRAPESAMSIAEKRNIAVMHADNDIIVHMDDDDYYYKNSVYHRVKALISRSLITGQRYECVGCTTLGVFNLMDNYDFKMNVNNVSEASLCYYKSFWEQQQFKMHAQGEGTYFLKNRHKSVLLLPFEVILVAITHNTNYTANLRKAIVDGANKSHELFNTIDTESQRLLNSIYRKLSSSS